MPFLKLLLASATLIAAASTVAEAQMPYPAYPGYVYPYATAPAAAPPSWSYDPYTSGMTNCPQRRAGDLTSCQQQMPPTYGQPSYWPYGR